MFEISGHTGFQSGGVCLPNPEMREQHVRTSVLSSDGLVELLGGGCVGVSWRRDRGVGRTAA